MNKKHCPICGRFLKSRHQPKSYCGDPECVLKASERVLRVKFKRTIWNDMMIGIEVIRDE